MRAGEPCGWGAGGVLPRGAPSNRLWHQGNEPGPAGGCNILKGRLIRAWGKEFPDDLTCYYTSEQGLVFENPSVQGQTLVEGAVSHRPSGMGEGGACPHDHFVARVFSMADWKPLVGCEINLVVMTSILQNGMGQNKMKRIESDTRGYRAYEGYCIVKICFTCVHTHTRVN